MTINTYKIETLVTDGDTQAWEAEYYTEKRSTLALARRLARNGETVRVTQHVHVGSAPDSVELHERKRVLFDSRRD